jgi:prolyl 4-hydroxylase
MPLIKSSSWLVVLGPLLAAMYVSNWKPSAFFGSLRIFHSHESPDPLSSGKRDKSVLIGSSKSIDPCNNDCDDDSERSKSDSTWFGVEQDVGPGLDQVQHHTIEIVHASNVYMNNLLQVDAAVTDYCRNHDASCSAWAALGECTRNPEYMRSHCAPACQCCDQFYFEKRCPSNDTEWKQHDIWQPGDLDNFFLQLATNDTLIEKYHAVIHRHPAKYGMHIIGENEAEIEAATSLANLGAPWIITVPNFLSAHECTSLIELGTKQGRERAEETGKVRRDGWVETRIEEILTSTTAFCVKECFKNETAQSLVYKMEALLGIPNANAENTHLPRYIAGQHYSVHHDYKAFQVSRKPGPRILTVIIYLNTLPLPAGGGTNFPMYNLTIQPTQGTALVFPLVLSSDLYARDDRTHHQALPIIPFPILPEHQVPNSGHMMNDDAGRYVKYIAVTV